MAIDISELTVFMVNLNNYHKPKLVQTIVNHNKEILKGANIITIDDTNRDYYFSKLPTYKKLKELNDNLFIIDEFRVYMSEFAKYPLYLDSDAVFFEEGLKYILEHPNENIISVWGSTNICYIPNSNDNRIIRIRLSYADLARRPDYKDVYYNYIDITMLKKHGIVPDYRSEIMGLHLGLGYIATRPTINYEIYINKKPSSKDSTSKNNTFKICLLNGFNCWVDNVLFCTNNFNELIGLSKEDFAEGLKDWILFKKPNAKVDIIS